MKKAVIVVGSHHVGKSKTINKYFKPLVNLTETQRSFSISGISGIVLSQSLEERYGYILSQSLEEKSQTDIYTTVERYKKYKRIVFAARPAHEALSIYNKLKSLLEKSGFVVTTVNILPDRNEAFYENSAKAILDGLQ